jgi:hypothetical protein
MIGYALRWYLHALMMILNLKQEPKSVKWASHGATSYTVTCAAPEKLSHA